MSQTASISRSIEGGSWCGSALQVNSGGDPCADIGGFVGALFKYIEPLRNWRDDLLGDAAQVAGFASSWEDASRTLQSLYPTLESAGSLLDGLDGRSARALQGRFDDVVVVSRDTSEYVAATAAALRLASRIVQATRTYVCDVLADLAELGGALGRFTWNPLEYGNRVKDFADAAFGVVESTGRFIDDVINAMSALAVLLFRLMPVVGDMLTNIKNILVEMLTFVPIVGGTIQNFLQESSDVNEIDPEKLSDEQRIAWEKSQKVTELQSLADLISVNSTTDAMGGEDRTVVDIKQIRAADGSLHWVVSLPSTQEWLRDNGALNDRDSNIALMLDNPVLKAAYERAVLDAMREAGVPPGADVVLTGFSQGGIQAVNLASDSSFPYNTIGVVTNGSPVDTFKVPPNIPVYSFQHANDVVPALDGTPPVSTPTLPFGPGGTPLPVGMPVPQAPSPNPNHHIVTLPPPPGNPLKFWESHNNDKYASSVSDWEKQNSTEDIMKLFGGEVVNHVIYGAEENRL